MFTKKYIYKILLCHFSFHSLFDNISDIISSSSLTYSIIICSFYSRYFLQYKYIRKAISFFYKKYYQIELCQLINCNSITQLYRTVSQKKAFCYETISLSIRPFMVTTIFMRYKASFFRHVKQMNSFFFAMLILKQTLIIKLQLSIS